MQILKLVFIYVLLPEPRHARFPWSNYLPDKRENLNYRPSNRRRSQGSKEAELRRELTIICFQKSATNSCCFKVLKNTCFYIIYKCCVCVWTRTLLCFTATVLTCPFLLLPFWPETWSANSLRWVDWPFRESYLVLFFIFPLFKLHAVAFC